MKNASVCGSAVYTHRTEVERHKFKKNQNQTQQIKETERKGVERAKEKLKNIQSICTHVCKFTYTGILRRALPIILMSGQKFSCF